MIPDILYNITVNLRVSYPGIPSFATEMYFLDSEEVPIYDRVRAITYDDVSNLESGSTARDIATAFYAQFEKADTLYLARCPRVAIPPAFICGTHVTTAADWAALGTGKTFTVVDTDTPANSTVVTVGDLSGVTAFSQVLPILNAALAALVTPDVVGLDDAEFALDVNGDIVLTMPSGQDDTDPNISITYNASTDTIPYLLGLRVSGAGESVPGNAVETLLESYTAAMLKAFAYNIATELRGDGGSNNTEIIALAAQIQLGRQQATFVDQDTDAVDSGSADDLHSQLKVLNYSQSLVIYTENDDYPDACADGAWLPKAIGRSYGHTPLSGCVASGSIGNDNDLSSTDRLALNGKGCNYVLTTSSGNTFVHRGKTAGSTGIEKRMVAIKHYLEVTIRADLEALDMNMDVLGFDSVTLGALYGILEDRLTEIKDAGGILSYDITLPKVSDFSTSDVASGDMVITKAFRATGRFEAHTFQIVGDIGLPS